ncbi:ABC transporter substrate-binding protein [Paenibacillus sp. UNC499MF]|uniref:ABC transporter substrate-binding protein n=1 Tax=Paenibacillus sp. UNC499MF TaxID=1502751 RepID=UPI0008A05351|nr:ABC transporter substrate-binding protein [Paenibacillus sp. UNC499MF]SEG67425.1 iron complex transport system substrate-binding protein [Paenibacillus sp. UNC499MF]
MKLARSVSTLLFTTLLSAALLSGCAGAGSQKSGDAAGTHTGNPTGSPASAADKSASTPRKVTDYKGHTAEIPAAPKKVIFYGETFSDLDALGVQAIGTATNWLHGTVYADKHKDITDIGSPINLEKVLELGPDLILTGSTDEKEYEQLSKIAPTLMFNTFLPLKERLLQLGDLLGKKPEAEKWLAGYDARSEAMWKTLHDAGVKPGETASVFTYYPGNRLFVMASTGLSQVLYDKNGFLPTQPIRAVLDEKAGFKQISPEVLPKVAGDRIFILTPVVKEAQQSTEELLKSRIWLDLPAVKNGNVYTLDILKSGSDAATREWLLNEIPNLLKK